ncbi:hypothetical protein [Actinomadura sp. WMMA1423]|uniref:hypothetical protein n=1 Tax=Actinomadura sp. WMMA1423 TaxID=2591108 RepID=UPI00197AC6DF|nr:hypothetical protein [Actinomadura sp. WMMA1423]
MHPVSCRRCGTCVLVKKNSLAHTEIQWTTDTSACAELWRDHRPDVMHSVTPTCEAMRGSVEQAVRDGLVPVPGEEERVP